MLGKFLNFGLKIAESTAHSVYGLVNKVGLVSSSTDNEFTTLSYYLSLAQLSLPAKKDILRKFHENAGHLHFLFGINDSYAATLATHPKQVLKMLWDGYGMLYNVSVSCCFSSSLYSRFPDSQHYLHTQYALKEDIILEVGEMGGLRYAENKALLAVVQQADLDAMGKQRVDEMLMDKGNSARLETLAKFPIEEAAYYIKFAVAAYGDNGIKSAQADYYRTFDWRNGDWTLSRVSEHTGIPQDDLKIMDVAYHSDPTQLRHFVALDRQHKKVILAIRGTYTQREIMIDFNGYSRKFLEGESHAAISLMAERLWDKVSGEIIQLLDENPGFELIVTGHSLGGGSTCIVNMLLHRDKRMQGKQFRAFAFASPPVYVSSDGTNVSTIKEAQTAVNYMNQYDGVPFLCGDTVRHQIAMITAIEKFDLTMMQRLRILLGFDKPDPKLVKQIHDIQRRPLPETKEGCPRGMALPVMGNVWIWPEDDNDDDKFKAVVADSKKMTETGIFIHKNDFTDHLPARYEYVLNHMGGSSVSAATQQ